jgi:hypothetical protein
MAYQEVGGIWMPQHGALSVPTAFVSSTLSAGTHQFAWCGRVWNKDKTTKSIRTIGFLPGTITTGSSTLRISLQDLDATALGRPDGGVDENVTFADTAITSSTWYTTGNLSADRSVAFGEKLAVVLDYSSYSSGSAVVQNLSQGAATAGSSWTTLLTAGWVSAAGAPGVILGFSDGTFGSLGPPGRVWPASASSTLATFNTGTTPDEIALRFTVPFACKITGGYFLGGASGSARTFDIILYEGTTVRASESFDGEQTNQAAGRYTDASWAAYTLAPGTEYFLAYKPTNASNNTINYLEVASADHFQAHAGGTEWYWAERIDAGAWSPTTTKRPLAGIIISALDDGVSTGGTIGVIGS